MLTNKIKNFNFKPSVIGEQISSLLTEAILENILKGEDQLVEAELQKEFGVSRSPLREAFRDLEKKGLVVIIPRKGTFVRKIRREDIEENFPVRATLEGLAAKEAHHKMTGKDLEKMKQTLQKMKMSAKKKDTKTYWKHHLVFHEIFIKASGNHVLMNILKTLRMHSMWYRFSYKYYQEDLKKALTVHQKILDLFQDQHADIRELENIVRNHIEVAYEKFQTYLEEQ